MEELIETILRKNLYDYLEKEREVKYKATKSKLLEESVARFLLKLEKLLDKDVDTIKVTKGFLNSYGELKVIMAMLN